MIEKANCDLIWILDGDEIYTEENIYNISKSLSHVDQKDWILLDKNWQSLSLITRKEFLNKLKRIKNLKPNIA